MTTKLANRDPIAILSESKSAIILESRDLLFAEKRALGMTLEESHSDFITRHVIRYFSLVGYSLATILNTEKTVETWLQVNQNLMQAPANEMLLDYVGFSEEINSAK